MAARDGGDHMPTTRARGVALLRRAAVFLVIFLFNSIRGAAKANLGLDSFGNVARAVPSSRLTAINTASVNQPVFIWTELSNAGFSPTVTSFTFIINWKDGAGNAVAESRWTATRDTTNDDINAGGITNNYSGNGVSSSQSGANTTSSTVTFTRGTTSVKVTASIVSFTGFTFKQ